MGTSEKYNIEFIKRTIKELSSLMEFFSKHEDDLCKKEKQSARFYYVLSFRIHEWQNNQIRFLQYNFFKNAKIKIF